MWNRSGFPPHLPEALELPLLDTEQLAGLPADDGGVPRRVVQDGLPERRPDSQSANGDGILQANAFVQRKPNPTSSMGRKSPRLLCGLLPDHLLTSHGNSTVTVLNIKVCFINRVRHNEQTLI